jgi:hypothetical protein
MLSYLALELLSIKAQRLCEAQCDTMISKGCLMLVEKVVHRPELSLRGSRFRSLSRIDSMFMDA